VASTIPMAVAIVRTGTLGRSGSDRDDMEGPIPALTVLMSPKTWQDGGPDQQHRLAMRPHRAKIAGVDVLVRVRHVVCLIAALASVLLAGCTGGAPDGRQVRPVTWHDLTVARHDSLPAVPVGLNSVSLVARPEPSRATIVTTSGGRSRVLTRGAGG
jgi:hypothetical protein